MFSILSYKRCSLLFTKSEITLIPTSHFSNFKMASAGYSGPQTSCVVVTSLAICVACDVSVMHLLQHVRQGSNSSACLVCCSAGLQHAVGHLGTPLVKQREVCSLVSVQCSCCLDFITVL